MKKKLKANLSLVSIVFFPKKRSVMRFLALDLSKIKCVIVGMEPYASSFTDKNGDKIPVATGRSFEVANVNDWQQKFKQSSLRNILKTIYYNDSGKIISLEQIRQEIAVGNFTVSRPHEWFNRLESQGVLFLNASLTVEPGKPDSHTALWHPAMDIIIRYIDESANVKWLLFGKLAQERIIDVLGDVENLYMCCHPRLPAFVRENIFQFVNEINWVC